MVSSAKLLADHGSLLVLDAASTVVQVGLLRSVAPPVWRQQPGEAGTALFGGVEAVLREAGMTVADVGAFAFCEGPGSMLGIRTVAMSLRTWTALRPRSCYAYGSLAVAAALHAQRAPGRSFTVMADARRESWHAVAVDAGGQAGPLRRLPTASLPAGELFMPDNFRTWSKLPQPPAACCYDLGQILAALPGTAFFRAVEAPEAFQHEAPDYRRWTPQVHSAETASR